MSSIIFQDGAIWAKSELNMINDSLLAVGETPFLEGTVVETLPIGTDGETAKRLIRTTMIEVQTRGWYFNLDYNFKLVPDNSGFITMPPNTLRLDFGYTEYRHQYTFKNGKVYDYLNHTYVIGQTLTADVTWLVDYPDLPPEAYEYISLRSARKFQQKVIGAQETDTFTVRDEVDALTNLQRLQLQTQDYRLSNKRVDTRIHNGYLIQGLYGAAARRRF